MYRPLAFLALVTLGTASIYFFIQDQDTLGRQYAFFALYAFILVYYFFKSLYYRKHEATFNELFFVVGMPLIPPFLVVVGQLTEVNDLYFSEFLQATITINGNAIDFSLAFASILSLPYFFFSLYLLFRTFVRYEFIRWTAHSRNGLPGTLVGILMTFLVGVIYLVVAMIYGDLLLGLFGFIYTINGVLTFLG